MQWGFMSFTHILSLVLSCGITAGLYFLLKNKSIRTQTAVLGVLSFSGISAIIFNLVSWSSPLEYLPLHLCSLTALILPLCVFTRNNVLCNLSILWSLGAILALVVNTAQAEYEILSWTFAFYYFPHTFEFAIPVLLFTLKLARKEIKYIWTSIGITLAAFTLIHFINLLLNQHCMVNNLLGPSGNGIQVNFMYSLRPENPVLDFFYRLIPHPYWYMWLAIPVMAAYLVPIYAREIVGAVKKHRK